MYARMISITVHPGKLDEVLETLRISVIPVAEKQLGYRGGRVLAERECNKIVSIAYWETEADMLASESSGYLREQITKVAPAFAAPPVTERFEVSIE